MCFKKSLIAAAITMIAAVSICLGNEGDGILGQWNTEEKDAVIEIFKCGGKYCGRVIWAKEPNYTAEDKNGKEGQSRVDEKNPDPRLRNQPIVGLQILHDFSFDGGNTWNGGIYNPENGKTYSGRISLKSPDILKLRGYILFSLLGGTTTWTRVSGHK